MTITLDTSVFVELLLDQEKAEDSKTLLESIANNETKAVVSHFAIHAIEAMMGRPKQKLLSEFLKKVEASKGLEVFDTSINDEQSIALLSIEVGLDFDDSMQLYVAKRTGSSAIVSFDRHFDHLEIPRLEPSQILGAKKKERSSRTKNDVELLPLPEADNPSLTASGFSVDIKAKERAKQ